MNTIKHSPYGWVAAVVAVLSTATAAVSPPTAAELIEAHLKMIGGRPALAKLTNLVFNGTGHEGQLEFSADLALKAPGFMVLTLKTADGRTFQHGRDSQARLWASKPDGARDVTDPRDQAVILDMILATAPFGQLRLAELYSSGVSDVIQTNNRTFYTIRNKTEVQPRLWFDAATGRLVRVGTLTLEDYRVVNGVKLPHSIRSGSEVAFQFTEARIVADLPDTRFARPASATAPASSPTLPRYQTHLSATGRLEIVRQPRPLKFRRGELAEIGHWDPNSPRHDQVDLRSSDLRALDLTSRLTDLLHSEFDSQTRWPQRMPAEFDPQQLVNLGRNPGLGIRALHASGVTGKGVGIGMIDQTLLVNHQEYRDRLRLYEEIHYPENSDASMHGPAVASIAVGKTCGVAPGAGLYYVAQWHSDADGELDFTSLAAAIDRLLDVNATLPAGRKLRVISISVGWSPDAKGGTAADGAVARAQGEGVFVVTTSIERHYGFKFHGLGREAQLNPDRFESFGLGSWWAMQFWNGPGRFQPGERLLVPMDSRAPAGPAGPDDYALYASAGWSWAVPWISGLYALACEVKPEVTPREFWSAALRTGRTIRVTRDGETAELGTLADPVALIQALKPRG